MKYLAEFAHLNPDLIFVLDGQGRIEEMNPAAADFLGPAGAQAGGLFQECVFPEERMKAARLITAPRGSPPSVEKIRLIDSFRQPRWFEVHRLCSPTRPLVYVHAWDITRIVEMERILEAEKQKSFFNAKMASLGEMAGGVAHEINNPLAVIMMAAKLVEQDVQAPQVNVARVRKEIGRVIAQAERITKIVRGLRDLARNDSQDPKKPHSVRAMVDDVLSVSEEKFKGADVRLEPPAFEDFSVPCRPVQVMQIVLNLLNNAYDAVRPLSTKWVRIDVRRVFDTFELAVTDSGHGIPQDVLGKIMQPFFTTKDVGKGTGLGLSISRAIAEEHGGRLFYDHHSPHTRFVLQLPLREGASLIAISAEDAISAHLAWKEKLLRHFEKIDSSLNPAEIAPDNRCSLGMWIYGVEDRYGHLDAFSELKAVHAKFHRLTSELVARRGAGEALSAEACLGAGSEYDHLSMQVIRHIERLKGEIELAERKKA